ncbi:AsnC family transcriptional regulator [Litorimonas taeanensis]|uniref:AsnC family transcriptional regulator n=1 Tax=Litorimonas taeanensis TaxID=568099 RepID=A0A420WER3_9PROT|nr:Lrp/AsnC family transcriptional regulator [Litorimonas taeanensis]RKQ69467.1 AsnC family transcriptional regulator [Litorimonas taeanensis]
MDSKDRQIIRALQSDGRMTNQDLAEKVNLSPSPCLRRLRNLEKSGIISGYSVDVDSVAYGLPVTVFVRVQLDKHTEDVVQNFEAQISKIDHVLECYMMTGRADYLLKVIVADLNDYEGFVRRALHPIGGIGSIDTSFAYGVVKKTSVFPRLHQNQHMD